jgi:hypothetical protein
MTAIDALYTHVYIVAAHYGEASNSEMLTVWTHLVPAESAASEKLQQLQITVLGSTEAEASEEVI